jgi:hypothetical protein
MGAKHHTLTPTLTPGSGEGTCYNLLLKVHSTVNNVKVISSYFAIGPQIAKLGYCKQPSIAHL